MHRTRSQSQPLFPPTGQSRWLSRGRSVSGAVLMNGGLRFLIPKIEVEILWFRAIVRHINGNSSMGLARGQWAATATTAMAARHYLH